MTEAGGPGPQLGSRGRTAALAAAFGAQVRGALALRRPEELLFGGSRAGSGVQGELERARPRPWTWEGPARRSPPRFSFGADSAGLFPASGARATLAPRTAPVRRGPLAGSHLQDFSADLVSDIGRQFPPTTLGAPGPARAGGLASRVAGACGIADLESPRGAPPPSRWPAGEGAGVAPFWSALEGARPLRETLAF